MEVGSSTLISLLFNSTLKSRRDAVVSRLNNNFSASNLNSQIDSTAPLPNSQSNSNSLSNAQTNATDREVNASSFTRYTPTANSESDADKVEIYNSNGKTQSAESVSANQTDKPAKPDASNNSVEAVLSEAELKQVQSLQKRDLEVKTHESAHLAAAGQYATGGASYEYKRGPDGKNYAVGGEVGIDTSSIPNNPEATIQKAQQIRAAAQAPAQPSGQDRQVAASAAKMEIDARADLMEQQQTVRKEEKVSQQEKKVYGNADDNNSTADTFTNSPISKNQAASQSFTDIANYTAKQTSVIDLVA